MSKTHSIVEINGNRYDAMTGKIVGAVKYRSSRAKTTAAGFVDGFVKPANMTAAPRKVERTVKHAARSVHKTTQRSRTLMRGGVKKPTHQHSDIKPAPKSPQLPEHATPVTKHSQVRRFGHIKSVAKPAKPSHSHAAKDHSTKHPEQIHAKATPRPLPSLQASATYKDRDIDRMLDHALATATSHKNTYHGHRRRHVISQLGFLPKWLTAGIAVIFAVVIVVLARTQL